MLCILDNPVRIFNLPKHKFPALYQPLLAPRSDPQHPEYYQNVNANHGHFNTLAGLSFEEFAQFYDHSVLSGSPLSTVLFPALRPYNSMTVQQPVAQLPNRPDHAWIEAVWPIICQIYAASLHSLLTKLLENAPLSPTDIQRLIVEPTPDLYFYLLENVPSAPTPLQAQVIAGLKTRFSIPIISHNAEFPLY